MTTTSIPRATDLETFAEAYGERWNTQDLDGIVERHHPDGTFHLHIPGAVPARGQAAIREAFAGFLAQLPDIHFATKRLIVGDGHWVLESELSGTVAASLEVEGETLEGDGRRVAVDCVDVMTVRDGLIASKDTYLDGLAFRAQMEGAGQ